MSDLTGDLLTAVVAAPPDRKEAALKLLRGEVAQPSAKTSTGPLLLGMGASAKFLGVSRATLWRILQAGTIQKVELFRGSYRVRREDLEDLAAGKFGAVIAMGKSDAPSTNSRLSKKLAASAANQQGGPL
jgi:excisionase family DNA binding protein